MSHATVVAGRFAAIDIHDDTVEKFLILPPTSPRRLATIELTFFRRWEGLRRVLVVSGCRNIRMHVDVDILAMNLPHNASTLRAIADTEKIATFVRSARRYWNLSFDEDPLSAKLAGLGGSVLFQVKLFGGVLEFLGASFELRKVD